ncbi:hypothetical protein CHU92_01250 [Flavobacterium cyanobacteriorum]|uniref:Uncharacterized protein n=1 Tax=Flavobacterium cyanobacteriorum TaxID=2022802 RepID=A0A255ZZD7_9FLAO|nr:hypothetical protein CHU92_01250 [Flavobacterium cyanobacteriorum]
MIIFLALSGCDSKSETSLQKYEALNSINKYHELLNNDKKVYFVVNTQLILSDSTFHYKTCAIKSSGIWEVNDDNLKLKFKTVKWIHESATDSIDRTQFGTANYVKIQNYLIRTVDTVDGYELVELLEKK